MLTIIEEEMKCFMRLLSENRKTMKEKTYDRMLQLPTVVKKLYSKENQKFKNHLVAIAGSDTYSWAYWNTYNF